MTRVCKKCWEEKELETEFDFHDGQYRRHTCNDCHKSYQKSRDIARRQDPIRHAAKLEADRIRNKNNPGIQRKYHWLIKYGLSEKEYWQMWNKQQGVCDICHNPETATRNGKIRLMSVDHNHATGKIRKLLCNDCNAIIGLAEENSTRLRNAAEYLDQNNQ